MSGKPDASFAEWSSRVELHPLEPFLPPNARLLMLGSFPPPRKRWSMDFFYPNMQNDMWRIFGLSFYADKNYFIDAAKHRFDRERIVQFLTQKGIALYDMATSVCRLKENASDRFLEVVEATDLSLLLRHLTQCRAVVTTGQKATELLSEQLGLSLLPKVGSFVDVERENGDMLRVYRMPSSSRAYPLPLEKKTAFYVSMFMDLFGEL